MAKHAKKHAKQWRQPDDIRLATVVVGKAREKIAATLYVVSAFRRTVIAVRLKPDSTYM